MTNLFGRNRRSIRLKEYDYTSDGAYFVTICTQDRLMLFGNVQNGEMHLSPLGEMAQKAWEYIPQHDPRISLDEFVVMPNHVHGIIIIESDELKWNGLDCHGGQARRPAPTISLIDVVHRFKSWTTNQFHRNNGVPRDCRLWQRNYYERIIRNEKELNHVRKYIRDNPLNWENDPEKGQF